MASACLADDYNTYHWHVNFRCKEFIWLTLSIMSMNRCSPNFDWRNEKRNKIFSPFLTNVIANLSDNRVLKQKSLIKNMLPNCRTQFQLVFKHKISESGGHLPSRFISPWQLRALKQGLYIPVCFQMTLQQVTSQQLSCTRLQHCLFSTSLTPVFPDG